MKSALCILLILLNTAVVSAQSSPYNYQLSDITSSGKSFSERGSKSTNYFYEIPDTTSKRNADNPPDYVFDIPSSPNNDGFSTPKASSAGKSGWATKLAEKSERTTFLKTPSMMRWVMRENVRVRAEKRLYGVQNSNQNNFKLYKVRSNAISEALRKGNRKRSGNLLGKRERLFGKGHNISGFKRR